MKIVFQTKIIKHQLNIYINTYVGIAIKVINKNKTKYPGIRACMNGPNIVTTRIYNLVFTICKDN